MKFLPGKKEKEALLKKAAEPKGRVVLQTFVINGGKVGQRGVDVGRGSDPPTRVSDLFMAVACISLSSPHILQNIQGSARFTAWLGWVASQTPP